MIEVVTIQKVAIRNIEQRISNKEFRSFYFIIHNWMFDIHYSKSLVKIRVHNHSVTLPPGKEIPFIFLKSETANESVIPEIKSIILNSRR
jgi:hypothetical protein